MLPARQLIDGGTTTDSGPPLKIDKAVEGTVTAISIQGSLTDGRRFRIGNFLLEYRSAESVPEEAPAHGDDGEEFCGHELQPLGYLDVIRPNNRPGPRFPITKRRGTVLGREGDRISIALAAMSQR